MSLVKKKKTLVQPEPNLSTYTGSKTLKLKLAKYKAFNFVLVVRLTCYVHMCISPEMKQNSGHSSSCFSTLYAYSFTILWPAGPDTVIGDVSAVTYK